MFENCLAVVGSRRMTEYGKIITTKLVSEIASAGISIVSGFMYGIDVTAHKAAIDVGGKTILVMPCGIDMIHPEHQKEIYKKILNRGGLVISEYPKNQLPARWTYIQRNRIVAGLSSATLVVQAAKKSGSLITAGYAKKYKRKIFSVPGPLTSNVSIGTANLIKKGACVVLESKDIINFYNPKQSSIIFKKSDVKEKKDKNKLENKIIQELQNEPLQIDNLCKKLNLSIIEIGITLSEMELKGMIKKENNKYYIQ